MFTGAYKITGNGLELVASYLTVKSADVFAVYVRSDSCQKAKTGHTARMRMLAGI